MSAPSLVKFVIQRERWLKLLIEELFHRSIWIPRSDQDESLKCDFLRWCRRTMIHPNLSMDSLWNLFHVNSPLDLRPTTDLRLTTFFYSMVIFIFLTWESRHGSRTRSSYAPFLNFPMPFVPPTQTSIFPFDNRNTRRAQTFSTIHHTVGLLWQTNIRSYVLRTQIRQSSSTTLHRTLLDSFDNNDNPTLFYFASFVSRPCLSK